jgi:hypothetical protein
MEEIYLSEYSTDLDIKKHFEIVNKVNDDSRLKLIVILPCSYEITRYAYLIMILLLNKCDFSCSFIWKAEIYGKTYETIEYDTDEDMMCTRNNEEDNIDNIFSEKNIIKKIRTLEKIVVTFNEVLRLGILLEINLFIC